MISLRVAPSIDKKWNTFSSLRKKKITRNVFARLIQMYQFLQLLRIFKAFANLWDTLNIDFIVRISFDDMIHSAISKEKQTKLIIKLYFLI